jgi:hypothetical protein
MSSKIGLVCPEVCGLVPICCSRTSRARLEGVNRLAVAENHYYFVPPSQNKCPILQDAIDAKFQVGNQLFVDSTLNLELGGQLQNVSRQSKRKSK